MFHARYKKRLTKKDTARIEKYMARMAKLFTIDRLTDDRKRLRMMQSASTCRRKRKTVTMPKFNLPPMGDS